MKKGRWPFAPLLLGLALLLAVLWLTSLPEGRQPVARAAPQAFHCVTPSGGGQNFSTVQAAVDAAGPGDEIRVAGGTYTDIHVREGITQVVYVTKTVTIRGGYSAADNCTSPPDTAANPTTLDAGGQGRVMVLTGTIAPTIEGLIITGGDATGLGGSPAGDVGGGILSYGAAPIIQDNVISGNHTHDGNWRGHGGGLGFVFCDDLTVTNNVITGNLGISSFSAVQGYGGGAYFYQSSGVVDSNQILTNTAASNCDKSKGKGKGGGLYLERSTMTLTNNIIDYNTAADNCSGRGGGLHTEYSSLTLTGNAIRANTGSTSEDGRGGGVFIWYGDTIHLLANKIIENTAASGDGGGILVMEPTSLEMTNNIIARNQADLEGSGLWIKVGTTAQLRHNTIADNEGAGQAIWVDASEANLTLANTIISGHDGAGITADNGATVVHASTLWYENGVKSNGAGTVVVSGAEFDGDPKFVNPAAWDYHIQAGSNARNAGTDASVTDDIDGEPRDAQPDIGADEFDVPTILLPFIMRHYGPWAPPCARSTKSADKEGVNAGETLQYTVVVKNSGDAPYTAVLGDTVPGQTSYVWGSASGCSYSGGEITWQDTLDPGASHTCTFLVRVADDAKGMIDNVAATTCPGVVLLPHSTPVMVTNGSFETGDRTGWTVSGDSVLPAPQVVDEYPFSDELYLLLGKANVCNMPEPEAKGDHASIARQSIYVPDVEGTPVLDFLYAIHTYDHLIWSDGKQGDSFDVYVGNELALRDNFENLPNAAPGCENLKSAYGRKPDNPWGGDVYPGVLDLSEWKGQSVEVRFELWTRWDGYYNTWAYLDDVRVEIVP